MKSDIMADRPTPDAAFVAALETAKDRANDLRDAIFAMMRAFPASDAQACIAAMTAPATAEALGMISFLCDGAGTTTKSIIGTMSVALGTVAPPESLDEFAGGLIRGMTAAAMSCACASCQFCEARRVDPEGAERRIMAELSQSIMIAKPKSRIVRPGGRFGS